MFWNNRESNKSKSAVRLVQMPLHKTVSTMEGKAFSCTQTISCIWTSQLHSAFNWLTTVTDWLESFLLTMKTFQAILKAPTRSESDQSASANCTWGDRIGSFCATDDDIQRRWENISCFSLVHGIYAAWTISVKIDLLASTASGETWSKLSFIATRSYVHWAQPYGIWEGKDYHCVDVLFPVLAGHSTDWQD